MATTNRWSQIVRTPGAVRILGHHPVDVPPLGEEPPYSSERAGLRLLVQPLSDPNLHWAIDVTSSQVMAMLDGFLGTGQHYGMRLSWRSRGFGSLRKDTLHLRPMSQGGTVLRVLLMLWLVGTAVALYSFGLLPLR